jgi:hypothetical protein
MTPLGIPTVKIKVIAYDITRDGLMQYQVLVLMIGDPLPGSPSIPVLLMQK